MNMMTQIGLATLPSPEALWAVLPLLPRTEIEAAVEHLIAHLDALDGDPDIEEDDHGGGNVTDEPHDEEDDEGDDGFALRRPHRDRIRATACDKELVGSPRYGQWFEYYLREGSRRGGRILTPADFA